MTQEIEIKTAKNVTKQSIAKDLSKLINAVSENNWSTNLGYSFGIYIVGNCPIEKIIQEISSINIGINILKKLHLIHFMSENYNPICESFYSLISNNSKTPHIVALL